MRPLLPILKAAVAATTVVPAAANGPVIIDDSFPIKDLYFVGGAPLACPGGDNPVPVGEVGNRVAGQGVRDRPPEVDVLPLEQQPAILVVVLDATTLDDAVDVGVFEAVANTVTSTGPTRQLVPGEGRLSFDAGRTVLDLDTNELVFSAGSHEFDAELCSVLKSVSPGLPRQRGASGRGSLGSPAPAARSVLA